MSAIILKYCMYPFWKCHFVDDFCKNTRSADLRLHVWDLFFTEVNPYHRFPTQKSDFFFKKANFLNRL